MVVPDLWLVQTRRSSFAADWVWVRPRRSLCLLPGCTASRSEETGRQSKLHQMPLARGLQPHLRLLTSTSRQAHLSRVIWSAIVKSWKPGIPLANSTILTMLLVESSANFSHKRWSVATPCGFVGRVPGCCDIIMGGRRHVIEEHGKYRGENN